MPIYLVPRMTELVRLLTIPVNESIETKRLDLLRIVRELHIKAM